MTTTSRPRHNNITATDEQRPSHERPRFNSLSTFDRLEEGSRSTVFPMSGKIRKGRRSIFREVGLVSEAERDTVNVKALEQRQQQRQQQAITQTQLQEKNITNRSTNSVRRASAPNPQVTRERNNSSSGESAREKTHWLSKFIPERRPTVRSAASAPPTSITGVHRFTMLMLLIAVVIPALGYTSGRRKVDVSGAEAGVIREAAVGPVLEARADSPADVCKRWAGQSAILNGTLYYYGGRVKASADQDDDDTWTNDFVSLDLTKSWDTSSPALSGMSQPSGPPAVASGYLWNDYDRLYLYGGQFQLSTPPGPMSIWAYDIKSSEWTEYKDPKTSMGQYSDAGNAAVQRASEGAGVSVPELGLSWYFGGHLDWATTPGWSDKISRVYLKSLLEFTHPGYSNVQVDSLQNAGAPDGGAFRNITWAGDQNQEGFTERADGVLVYVPGWGPGGILLGLGGGVVINNETADGFSSMTTIDVYDIASSRWYMQQTSGEEIPDVRVNPCAVVFSAPDASSFNIYMYGGQNLLPIGEQKQYADVWILTIPSFTWIKVPNPENAPPARAGHSCAARDGQVVVVGGWIGQDTSEACEQPGVHAFDASQLVWQSKFNAADHAADANADNTVLAGSHGYRVPDLVQSVIGGSSEGGATATQPASGPATDGPFKTGVPPVYTITAPADPGNGGGSGGSNNNNNGDARRGGTIAAGVIAGVFGLLAVYLGFCAWLWRRQVRAYKAHMAIANGAYGDGGDYSSGGDGVTGALAIGGEKLRKKCPVTGTSNSRDGKSSQEEEHFGWVGQQQFVPAGESPRPGSGTAAGSGPWLQPMGEDRGAWRASYDSYRAGVGDIPAAGAGAGGVGGVGGGAGGRESLEANGVGGAGVDRSKSTRSDASADGLLDGREPNFFSVVLGPRRALRVVNGIEEN